MNKLTMAALLLCVVAFGSCRKEYTCKCTTSTGGANSIVNERELSKQSLGDARTECDKGDSKIGDLETECEVKL